MDYPRAKRVGADKVPCSADGLAHWTLGGTVEIDEFFLGGRPKKRADETPPGRGRKGLRRTTKRPVLAVVQRPSATSRGAPPAMPGPRWCGRGGTARCPPIPIFVSNLSVPLLLADKRIFVGGRSLELLDSIPNLPVPYVFWIRALISGLVAAEPVIRIAFKGTAVIALMLLLASAVNLHRQVVIGRATEDLFFNADEIAGRNVSYGVRSRGG